MTRPAAAHDLLFAYDFPPMGGGIARWMEALVREYAPGELVVSTGTLDGAATTDASLPQRIDRIATNSERLRTVHGVQRWSRRAVALAREPGARFAWCDTVRPAGYPAHWAFRRTALPYGIMVVGGDLLTLAPKLARNPLKRRIVGALLRDAAALVAISGWTARRLEALLREVGIPAAVDRIRTVPLGTDPARWTIDPVAAADFRQRRRLPDARWLVTVARLVEYKGVDTTLRALAALLPAHPDLRYAVIGRGPFESSLRVMSHELGVADRVHFLTEVSDAELAAAYSIGTVYVGPTRETPIDVEGFGISFVEAAACGLPVVATRSGGIPDAVDDGVTGILVDEDDDAGVANAIDRLLANRQLAVTMGRAGRRRVEDHFNWARVVRDMQAIAAECAVAP